MTSAGGLDLLTLHGRERMRKVPDGAFLLDPALSPDGETIAYIRQPPASRLPDGTVDFGSDLVLGDRQGKKEKLLARHATTGEFIRQPVFLADGKTILIGVRGQDAEGHPDFRIERVDLASGARSRLIEHATAPALNPDGHPLAYVGYNPFSQEESLMTRDLGSGRQAVLVPEESPLVLIQSLAWSPDGKTLAFMSSDITSGLAAPSGQTGFAAPLPETTHPSLQDLWLIDADGKNLRRLVELVEQSPSVAWSADGSKLYVMAGGGFWRIDPETAERATLGLGVLNSSIVLLP
jgi:Tol biopolymer transport system component